MIHEDLFGLYEIVHSDAFDWLESAESNSIHVVVRDPPHGLLEYTERELLKRKNGTGGVWRIPPSFDGAKRQPIPRFTVLGEGDKEASRAFFDRLQRA